MKEYNERLIDRKIERNLQVFGGVIVQGARATGKSTSAEHLAKSSIRLDSSPDLASIAQSDPNFVLQGDTPHLIDEWQLAPNVWNAARHEIDQRQKPGQFILTGSATPSDDITHHTGAGRFGRITMRTMSLSESGNSTKQVSFSELLSDGPTKSIAGYGGLNVEGYAQKLIISGWPALINRNENDAITYLESYIEDISRVAIKETDTSVDPVRMRALIRAISRNISTEVSTAKLSQEARLFDANISEQTVRKYLDQLTRVFVLEELPAWNVHIRSKVRQRVAPKWHFVDPSIASASLGLKSDKLLEDLETFGFFFESLAVRDLRVYAESINADVFQYRDESGLEVDAIVETRDGKWAAFEAKLGGNHIEEGIKNVQKLAGKVSDEKRQSLTSLNVITGGNVSYVDEKTGVNVISLGHLFE